MRFSDVKVGDEVRVIRTVVDFDLTVDVGCAGTVVAIDDNHVWPVFVDFAEEDQTLWCKYAEIAVVDRLLQQ